MTALTPAVFTSGIHEECLVFGPQHPDSLFDWGVLGKTTQRNRNLYERCFQALVKRKANQARGATVSPIPYFFISDPRVYVFLTALAMQGDQHRDYNRIQVPASSTAGDPFAVTAHTNPDRSAFASLHRSAGPWPPHPSQDAGAWHMQQ